MHIHQLYIDGAWRAPGTGDSIAVVNPATGGEIARIAMADTGDMDDALAAAERGFRIWRATAIAERGRLLHAVAALLRERVELIAYDLSLEQGKLASQAKGEIFATAAYFDDLAICAMHIFDRIVPRDTAGIDRMVLHEPIGPVFAVSPWNLPAMMPGRKIANSLAAGCSIIVKPAKETPVTACHLAQCCHDAGIPPGVVNILCGPSELMSQRMIASPVIRKVSFTGSTDVGKELAALAGAHMKKATMELGGHAPVIVCADADLDQVVPLMLTTRHANAGQSCMAPTRFFVATPLYEAFCDRFTAGVKALALGPGLAPDTDMGPLASHRRIAVMQQLVDDAAQKGATVSAGSVPEGSSGFFYPPTVLTALSADAAILTEEPFGPVTPIMPFDAIDTVISRANETPYGLAAYIFTPDMTQARVIAGGLDAGMIAINSASVAAPSVPFGGVRDSGIGREGSFEGILESMVTKSISIGPVP
jgi:succinate-semialdehyde dehydrogenase / glutarate-semialdehyde dehydrogenase